MTKAAVASGLRFMCMSSFLFVELLCHDLRILKHHGERLVLASYSFQDTRALSAFAECYHIAWHYDYSLHSMIFWNQALNKFLFEELCQIHRPL